MFVLWFVVQKRQLDDRIEQIVFRVEEFKQQLLWMHQNVSSTSEKVSIVHAKLEQLMALFERIDQVEVCVVACYHGYHIVAVGIFEHGLITSGPVGTGSVHS